MCVGWAVVGGGEGRKGRKRKRTGGRREMKYKDER